MMKKREKTCRRMLSSVLTAIVAGALLTGGGRGDMSEAQAAASLANPRTNNGVVTWDCVYFGRYAQSDAGGEKKDPIKWRVLSVNGNDAFLIADVNLDAQQYFSKWEEVTWKVSIIRSWLNGYGGDSNKAKKDYRNDGFINKAFALEEQEAILTTTVVTQDNPLYATTGGSNTSDKLFLLSYDEVRNPLYGFSSSDGEDPARVRQNTAYVGAGGVNHADGTNAAGFSSLWWLRSPGSSSKNAMYVGTTGILYRKGGYVETEKFAVCPALHLDLSASNVWSFAGTVSSDGSSTAGDNPPTVKADEIPLTDLATEDNYLLHTDAQSGEETLEYRAPQDNAENVVVQNEVTISGKTYKVTSIADDAFRNNKKIKTVVIGDSVKTIGKNAFSGCTNLQTLTIGKNVTAIGDKAFFKCKKLKKVTIPSKVSKIGKQAFYGCKKLKSITLKTPKLTKKNVGSKAFKGIYSRAAIKVPKKKLKAYKTLLKARGVGTKAKIKK